ncbi:MAG: Tetratricopeptide repeat [Proteobacteria bacterium]|nr:Tetratricopeptide repeat [Pseudomonadota bacterium]
MTPLILHLALAAAQAGTLSGYVFRETDGNPPRRPMTVELSDGDRTRYRETTEAGGMFMFRKVQEGHYTIRVRFGDFVAVDDRITVTGSGNNFAAVMLPKRRAKSQDFRAVTADRLASQSNGKLRKSLRKAAKLVARHDLSGAVRLYEQVAAVDATADLWDTLGLLYLQMGRKDDSIHAFEKAISQDPEYLLPYAHLGWFYQQERRYNELLKLAGRALAADPQWMTAHALLGEARVGTGDLEAALQSVQRASALVQGKAAGPYLLMAELRYLHQDCAGARIELGRYLELNTSARGLPGTAKLLELLRGCRRDGAE